MPELIPENDLPINRVAKQKLKEANQEISEAYLYSLQLMSWGIENRQSGLVKKFESDVGDMLNSLYGVKPKAAMAFLLKTENPDDEPGLDYEALSLESPKVVAQILLNHLHWQMSFQVEGYPPL